MHHNPYQRFGGDESDYNVSSSANVASMDWDALTSHRATKRKYGGTSSSLGSARSSANSFLEEDLSSGSSSEEREDSFDPVFSTGSSKRKDLGRRCGARLDPYAQIWTRLCSDWEEKWTSVPEEDSTHQTRGPAGKAVESSAQLSSSSSLSVGREDSHAPSQKKGKGSNYFRKALPKAVNEAIQRRVLKRNAKKWFIQLTAKLDNNESGLSQVWRQRRVAAKELLRIAERNTQGVVAVAQRFVKSSIRQVTGLRAILRLCEEEEASMSHELPQDARGFEYDKFCDSYLLMVVVMLHVDRSLFLEKVVPDVLQEQAGYGFRCILFLATSIPDFFTRVDPVAISKYAKQAIGKGEVGTSQWLHGIELLYCLFRHYPHPEPGNATMLSVGRLILTSIAEIRARPSGWYYILILRVLLWTLWIAEDMGILLSILPSRDVIGRLFQNLISEQPTVSNLDTTLGLDFKSDLLQLKALALLANHLQIRSLSSPYQLEGLGRYCVFAMSNPRHVQARWRNAMGPGAKVIPLHIDEDAFQILRNLPEPTFQDALKSFLPPDPARFPLSATSPLDLLLWLSNMPASVVEAHRALIGSDSCNFLSKIVASPVSLTWKWEERDIWRHKGQAMTCLGNVIERMDKSELRGHVPREMIEAVLAIKENEETPLAQRDQARFMLQRYTTASDRCGIEPYHREAAIGTED